MKKPRLKLSTICRSPEDQADEINGGGWGTLQAAPWLNHNETTVEDGRSLRLRRSKNLPVAENQADEINGVWLGIRCRRPRAQPQRDDGRDEEVETEALEILPVAEDQQIRSTGEDGATLQAAPSQPQRDDGGR
jgi:hypothetical protein